jgi:hypothetical protein
MRIRCFADFLSCQFYLVSNDPVVTARRGLELQCRELSLHKQCLHKQDPDQRSIWWSQTGSNRRPHACKARALPAELWPRTRRRMLRYARRRPSGYAGHASFRLPRGCATRSRRRSVVGLGRLELPTSRLSSARSNQLSYKPLTRGACSHAPASRQRIAQAQPLARVRPRRKRNVDGGVPPMELNRSGDLMAPDVSEEVR